MGDARRPKENGRIATTRTQEKRKEKEGDHVEIIKGLGSEEWTECQDRGANKSLTRRVSCAHV